MLWLLDTPAVNGLFNLGTGRARSYLDLAHAVCDAAGRPRRSSSSTCRRALRGQYQSFTEAPMDRLRAAGYAGQFTPLEEGVRRYVQDYLAAVRPVRMISGPAVSAVRPGHRPARAVRHPLVRAGLYRQPGDRLAAGAPAGARGRRRWRRRLQVDDFLTWATLGVVLGGRLGYVLFYQPGVYLAHPAQIFAVWHGGMSFHGGMLGVAVAIVVFCRRNAHPAARLRRPHRGVRADRAGPRAASPISSTASCGAAGAAVVARGDGVPERRAGGASLDAGLRRAPADGMRRVGSLPLRAALSQRALRGAAGRPGAVLRDVAAGAAARRCARGSAG